MDLAANMEGNLQVSDDNTWSYTWSYAYTGGDSLADAHEEFILTNESGTMLDFKAEAAHSLDPGQTYIGGGWGNQKIPGGTVNWSLRVIQGGEYVGFTGGSILAMVPTDP
jgi:hypothetical protein